MSADRRARRRRLLFAGAALGAIAIAVVIVLLVGGGGSPRPAASVSPTGGGTVTGGGSTAGAAPLGPPGRPPPTSEQFGANVNRLFNDQFSGHGYTAGEIDAQLRALRATGATVARSDALWSAVEPAPPAGGVHRFQWQFDDQVAGALAAAGLQWLPIIDYSAGWAVTQPGVLHSPPSSASDYAAFASAFAARYGPGGAFWSAHPQLTALPVGTYEIWNEPDNGEFWSPAPDAAAYVDLYLSARTAITGVDPTARVIVGGLTNPSDFLPAMLRARPDLAAHLDGVAIHPYGPDPQVVLAKVAAARGTLVSLGLASVPLYVTEFGWTTHPPGALSYAPESRRPGYISTTLSDLGHTNCGVAATTIYTWVTPERDPADSQDWFGIHPPAPADGSSPDSVAFASGLRAAVAPGPQVAVCGAG